MIGPRFCWPAQPASSGTRFWTGPSPSRGSPFFYSRVKGELEADLAALAFPSLTLVRPGLIGGGRVERCAGEHAALLVLERLGPVLPKAWRINPAARIAEALLDAALDDRTGTRIIGSAEMA